MLKKNTLTVATNMLLLVLTKIQKVNILSKILEAKVKIREEFRFYGRVQGVGFRYTAKYLALSLEITGWVYNDYDGSVLMQAQGSKEKIDLLIQKLETSQFIFIENIIKKEIPLQNNETYFEIKGDY